MNDQPAAWVNVLAWCEACNDASAAPDERFCGRCDDALSHLNLLFYGDLHLCGCGVPGAAYSLIRDILALAPFFDDGRWKHVEELIGQQGAHHIVLSALTHAGLLMHGGSIGGSWLTERGAHYLNLMTRYGWELVDGDVGYPHDGEDCPPSCIHLKFAETGPKEQFQ